MFSLKIIIKYFHCVRSMKKFVLVVNYDPISIPASCLWSFMTLKDRILSTVMYTIPRTFRQSLVISCSTRSVNLIDLSCLVTSLSVFTHANVLMPEGSARRSSVCSGNEKRCRPGLPLIFGKYHFKNTKSIYVE